MSFRLTFRSVELQKLQRIFDFNLALRLFIRFNFTFIPSTPTANEKLDFMREKESKEGKLFEYQSFERFFHRGRFVTSKSIDISRKD